MASCTDVRSYRSQTRVGHRVSARLAGLGRSGVLLRDLHRLLGPGLLQGDGGPGTQNFRFPQFRNVKVLKYRPLVSGGVQNVHGGGPLQPPPPGEGAAKVPGEGAVVPAGEFTDQLLDAAAALLLQVQRKSPRRVLRPWPPRLPAGLVGNGRSLGGSALRCVLKDGKTLAKPPKCRNTGKEREDLRPSQPANQQPDHQSRSSIQITNQAFRLTHVTATSTQA